MSPARERLVEGPSDCDVTVRVSAGATGQADGTYPRAASERPDRFKTPPS